MALDVTLPDPTQILELTEAFRRSQVMFSAVQLGVFDRLERGALNTADLAKELNLHEDSLGRLLDGCVALQLLVRDGGRFQLTPAAAVYLTSQSPRRLTGYIRYSDSVLWGMWAKLADSIREGTNRWKQVYGSDGPVFDNLFRTEEAKREFLWGMHGYGLISSPLVASAFDLSRFRKLVDCGGATGHLAAAACERYPNMEAVLFDLPQVTPMAREVLDATPVAKRVTVIAGDFFSDPLPDGDLYALGRILHDWPEPKIASLLSRIHARLPSRGGILVAEKLLRDDRNGPMWSILQSLNMLVAVEGRERTLGEYETLLKAAGFTNVRGSRTTGPLDAVLAIKP